MALNFKTTQKPARNSYRALRDIYKQPIIYLGLGGVGSASVSKIKKLFDLTFEDDANAGGSGIPEGIRFLCFDSATSECPSNLARDSQWFQLTVENYSEAVGEWRKDPFYKGWLPDLGRRDFLAGVGGLRSLGRLLFTRNIGLFSEKFDAAMNGVLQYPDHDNRKPLVYVFASLAGGTGSGCLLDACFYIRKAHPQAEILAFLGVLGGKPTDPPENRRNASMGTFAALKEIDVFMARTRPSREFEAGVTLKYPADKMIQGIYAEPFTHCYLVSSRNDLSTRNLASPDHISSFMARSGFMLGSYQTDSASGMRSYAAEAIDRTTVLGGAKKGANACYHALSLCQIHVPREVVADYLTAHVARKLLSYIAGGEPHPDAESARTLADGGVSLDALVNAVSGELSDGAAAGLNWGREIERELRDKGRYKPAVRDRILAYGDGMGPKRIAEHGQPLDAWVAARSAEICESILDKLASNLKAPQFRMAGALDFLGDMESLLTTELDGLQLLRNDQLDPEQANLDRQWGIVRPLVEDVCTKGGLFDLDALRLGRTISQYAAFLRVADRYCLDRARYEKAGEVLSGAREFVRRKRQSLSSLQTLLRNAEMMIGAAESDRAAELRQQSRGLGSSEQDICSFSMVDDTWLADRLADPAYTPEEVLKRLAAGQWSPVEWLSAASEQEPAATLAEDVCRRIDREYFGRIRTMAVTDLLTRREQGDPEIASEILVKSLDRYASPQLRVSRMKDFLNSEPRDNAFLSGLDADLFRRLGEKSDVLKKSARASRSEDDKITCLRFFYPVAIAGCDDIAGEFRRIYSERMAEIGQEKGAERENGMRMNHCFAGSHEWPDPTWFRRTSTQEASTFVRAHAISRLLDPASFSTPPPKLISAIDAARTAAGGSPKEVRLGVFSVGANFWITPGFDIDNPMGIAPPIRLGAGLVNAWDAYEEKSEAKRHAEHWVRWFDGRWHDFYRSDELEQALDRVLTDARTALAKREEDTPDHEKWSEMVGQLEDWKRELLQA